MGQKKTNITRPNKETDSADNHANLQNDCYAYMSEFAKTIFENEERREDSLIQQAGHMQTAFSFVIAALFMVAAIVIEYRGVLSLAFLLIAFSSITAVLMASLCFATMAQNRMKRDDFPKVSTMKNLVISEYQMFETPAQRSKYLLDTYEKMHTSYEQINDKRQKNVKFSMNLFYVSLALCVFWFVMAICKLV